MISKYATSLFNPSASTTNAQKLKNIQLAKQLGFTHGRFDVETSTVATNRPNADYSNLNLDILSYNFETCLEYGLSPILGMYFAPDSGTWVGTDNKNPDYSDVPYISDLFLHIISWAFETFGLNEQSLSLSGWNEFTHPPYNGGDTPEADGDANYNVVRFMNYIYPRIRAEYPDIWFSSPSFVRTTTFGGSIKDANFALDTGSDYDVHWDVYNSIDAHIYPNLAGAKRFVTPKDIVNETIRLYKEFVAAVKATTFWELKSVSGTSDISFSVSEIGMNFINGHFRNDPYNWGGQKVRFETMALMNELMKLQPELEYLSWYRCMSRGDLGGGVDEDDPDDAQHYAFANSLGNLFSGAELFASSNGKVISSTYLDEQEAEIIVPV